MYNAGYHSITNVDYSSVCISTMRARHSDCLGMTWHEMDIRQLSFSDASFDVILEKATLDAIMVEEKSPWELSPQTACFIQKALTEVRCCSNVFAGFCPNLVPFPTKRMSGNRGFQQKCTCFSVVSLCVGVLRQRSNALNFKLNRKSDLKICFLHSGK